MKKILKTVVLKMFLAIVISVAVVFGITVGGIRLHRLNLSTRYNFNYLKGCNMENKTRPYDGIVKMLSQLKEKGIKTAVLSNKFDAATVRLCNNLMPKLIDLPVGERADFPRNPSPEAVYDIIDRLGAERENTVFVGDSDTDIKTGKNANVATVAVTWGYRNRKLLEESFADYMADTVDELCEILINKI